MKFSIPWKDIHFYKGGFRLSFTRLLVKQNTIEYESDPLVPGKIYYRLRIGYHLPRHMFVFHRTDRNGIHPELEL